MSDASKNNNQNKAFLELCGISYGETWMSLHPKKLTITNSALDIHLEALVLALQATLPRHKVEIKSAEKLHQISINDNVVMTYKPHWFTGEMQYKRRHYQRLSINTVAHGDFVGGLVSIFMNAIFGSEPKNNSEQSAQTLH